MATLRPIWDQFGINLGSIWDQFGINLGSFGDNVGITEWPLGDQSVSWQPFGDNWGINWLPLGDHLDGNRMVTTLGSVWDPLVTNLWLFCEIQTLIKPKKHIVQAIMIISRQFYNVQRTFTFTAAGLIDRWHKFFNLVRNEGHAKKIARGGWSGLGKALTWDPSQTFFPCFGIHPKIIDVHPKLIPKGGVIQFLISNIIPE